MANSIRIGGGGSGSATLITKTITQNGTYSAQDDNADGYSEVSVDVAGGGTVVQNLRLNEGKIATATGEIVADSDYYYTDFFDMPSGYLMFDMNLNTNQTYDGLVIYDDSGNYNNYWNPNARFRVVNMASYYHAGYKCRLSFRKSNIDYVMLRDYNANILYTTNTPVVIGDENYHYSEYVDISSFAHYYKRNTTTPTITPISSTEVSLTFQDQNSTGYELCSFSVPLEKGLYVAEIYATLDKNTGLANRYTWGVYSSNTSGGASLNDNSPMDNTAYDTYVPFDKSDTNEHYYEVPIKVLSDGTAYICFAMADDNGVNATITVRSLKIRKAYGSESIGIDYIESFLVSTDTSEAFPTEVFYTAYSDGVLTRVKYSRQEGGRIVTIGDFQSFIGDNSNWLWQVTALDDMEIRVDDITNGTQGQKQQVHSGDIILSGVPITGLYQYEIKRYS